MTSFICAWLERINLVGEGALAPALCSLYACPAYPCALQAHVMHNEESRKYVTIIKRLMTWCQTRYPSVPSKSVYS